MSTKSLNLSKRVQSKDIYNCLLKNFNLLSADWLYHQWNWLHQNYDAFNDLIKYFISISLIRNTFRIYQENGFKYNYDEYYSRDEIQIGEFNISELAKEFVLPKETMRRKILELEKAKVIRKQGKKLIFDKSAYNLVKPINQIKITSKYLSKFSNILVKEKIIDESISEEQIIKRFKNEFSKTWLWFYEFQLPLMIRWKNFFEDINSFYIWGTCGLNQVYNLKSKNKSEEIESIVLDDFLETLLEESQAGLNIMSISEMTKIPRATVIRKIKFLEKEKLVQYNNKKQYFISNFTPLKITPIIKKQFLLKSDFVTKMINLFVVDQSN